MRLRHVFLAALVLAGLCAAPLPAAAIWPTAPPENLAICTAAGDQGQPVVCPDGGGGVYVAWVDGRIYGCNYIFVQHVFETGDVDPEWPVNGLPVSILCNTKSYVMLVPDGVGGVIAAWSEVRGASQLDIYAQRLTDYGVIRWAANGVPVCTETNNQMLNAAVSDGNGGAVLAWTDYRAGVSNSDVYAQRIDSTGAAQWATNGVAVCTAANNQGAVVAASDSAGGVILAWNDERVAPGNTRVYAQHLYASGTAAWSTNGNPMCASPALQSNPTVCTDGGGGGGGGGGAIIAWQDFRAGNYDIYAQSVSAAGFNRWSSMGLPVCTAVGTQQVPMIQGGGAGSGADFVWLDQRSGSWDVYAQRLTLTAAPMWAANGVAVCTSHTCSSLGRVLSDDSCGIIIAWTDTRGGDLDVYAQRLDSTGTAHWATNGVGVAVAAGSQTGLAGTEDGHGGSVFVWQDGRSTGGSNIQAQRNAPNGRGGHKGPGILSVKDVPNDQGGRVIIKWQNAELDRPPKDGGKGGEGAHGGKGRPHAPPPVDSYWIWRQAPAARALAELAHGARLVDPAARGIKPGPALFRRDAAGPDYFWEFVAEQPAGDFLGHSYVASTTGDSVGGSNPYTRFLIDARDSDGRVWASDPDSGYSVDNLPPAEPSLFVGTYSGTSTALHWGRNTEADLAGYRLYRGASEDFVPDPGSLVIEKADTGYVDAVAGGHYYKLCAVDVHGNVSACALLTPRQTGGLPGDVPTALWLGRAAPNPSSGDARIGYGLPREARVSLTLHDATGRLVRRLADGTLPAGAHGATWDGRDDAGRRVASGLYAYRLTADGRTLTGRLVLTR